MPRWLYSLLLRCALPCMTLAFAWRGWRSPAYRGSLRQRLGWGLMPRDDRPLWLHAASVGEVRALAVLVRALHGQGMPLLVTVGTPVGLARARELFAGTAASEGVPSVAVLPAPWDLPGAVQRFLRAVRPRAGVFIETELWPNLVAAARDAGLSLSLISARLSARSLSRYQRLAPQLMHDTVCAFAAIGAQSPLDQQRFVALGADPAVVSVMGNLKFELQVDAAQIEQGAALRRRWAPQRALWVAGSTHPGEEDECLRAHRELLQQARAAGGAAPLLGLAPRRPERFATVARWLEEQGMRMARSTQEAVDAAADVVLIDAMGVLGEWYAAADAAFVGGSMVPVGGHNLLEPAALGRPVLAGPHGYNAPEVAQALLQAGGLQVVTNAGELAAAVSALLKDPALARQRGEQGARTVAASRGALSRARAMIDAMPGI